MLTAVSFEKHILLLCTLSGGWIACGESIKLYLCLTGAVFLYDLE